MDDLISRQATYLALVEKGQASKRYKLGETWELNGEEIREVLDALPSAQPEINCSEFPNNSDAISRQAAIETAKKMYVACDTNSIDDYEMLMEEALKVLPSALGTNLAEVGTDTISRQRVIEALGELATFTEDWSCHTWMYTDDVYNAIKQLPPIQPKRGRWHYSDGKPARIGLSFGVICDQCGTESEYCTNFCGECGADMRGEQDG